MPVSPQAIAYGDLTEQHEQYSELAPVRRAIEDFYAGGHRLSARADKYIPRLVGENPKRHAERIKSGAYVNYFAQITDSYSSALFTQELAVRPPADASDPTSLGGEPDEEDDYTRFSKNADGKGRSLNELLRDLVITALKQGSAWVHVEMPPPAPATSRADEEALGLGLPYVFEVAHEQIIDWDFDDDEELVYVVIHTKRRLKGPPGRRVNKLRETFEVWTRAAPSPEADPVVSWARYEIAYDPARQPTEQTPVALLGEGDTSFPRIPLLQMVLPEGLWLGDKLCPMAREHFQRRTSLNSAENRSMVAIPVAKLGPEIAAPTGPAVSEAQEDPGRGHDPVAQFVAKGYEVIGAGDSLEFVEPSGAAYAHVAMRISDLKDEMFRVAHQMSASVSMDTSALNRSGVSKQEDRLSESLVLGALGRIVRNFGVRLYDTIGRARADEVEWVAHGLDSYEFDNREQVIEEGLALQSIEIPSATFKKEHCKRLVRKFVPNLPPASLARIDQEIEAGVDDHEKLRELGEKAEAAEAKAAAEHADDPPPAAPPPAVPAPPTAKAPQAKAPKASAPKAKAA